MKLMKCWRGERASVMHVGHWWRYWCRDYSKVNHPTGEFIDDYKSKRHAVLRWNVLQVWLRIKHWIGGVK